MSAGADDRGEYENFPGRTGEVMAVGLRCSWARASMPHGSPRSVSLPRFDSDLLGIQNRCHLLRTLLKFKPDGLGSAALQGRGRDFSADRGRIPAVTRISDSRLICRFAAVPGHLPSIGLLFFSDGLGAA